MHSAVCVYSWTVLRSQCIAEETSVMHAKTEVSKDAGSRRLCGVDEWCSDADDWDDDADDSSSCTINEIPTSDGHVLIDGLSRSEEIDSANVENINASSQVPDNKSVETKPVDMSSDDPELLLMRLTFNDQEQKQVSTISKASADDCYLSDANGELSIKSSESKSNAAAELEPYYIYVTEESAVTDHSSHVDDLLTRYRLQEGSSAELESGDCT